MRNLLSNLTLDRFQYAILLIFAFFLPLSRAINNIAIALLVVIWLYTLFRGNFKPHARAILRSRFAIAILMLIGYTTLSLLWTENYEEGLSLKLLYWQWLTILAIGLTVKARQVYIVIGAFVLGMLVSATLSYGMYWEWWSINDKAPANPSPFMWHIDYSILLAFTSIILLNCILSKHYTSIQKAGIALLFAIFVSVLFINVGRTGQATFIVGVFATAFIHYNVTVKSLLGSLAAVSLIFMTAYMTSEGFQKRVDLAKSDIQKIDKGEWNTSLGIRAAIYVVASDIAKESPLLGVGVGDYKDAAREALAKNDHGFSSYIISFIPKYHFHSQYLNTLVQGGVIGLFLVFGLFYTLAKLPIRDPELKELSQLTVVIMLVAFISEPLWAKQFTNMLFVLFSGLFLAASLHGDTDFYKSAGHP
jgi:O-antigen ligase